MQRTIYKIYRCLIFSFIILLPFYVLPERYALPFLGGNLAMIPIVVSFAFLIYEYLKYGFVIETKIKCFIYIYFGWQLTCLFVGLVTYEFNEFLTLDQIPRLEKIIDFLNGREIFINEMFAIKTWLFLRFAKNILFANSSIFFISYLILHTYRNNLERSIKDIKLAVMVLFLVLGIYSFVELSWLYFKANWAVNILTTINPWLYDVAQSHGWWPPLLWKGQLRSILGEPSHFGVLAIFVLPLLWSCLIDKNLSICFFISYVTVMIFATNARTAVIAVFIELFVLIALNVIVRTEKLIKISSIIMLCSLVAFVINLSLSKYISENNISYSGITIVENVERYVEKNVGTVTKTNVRSNNARLIHLISSINTIKENPVFGVGEGLHSAYIDKNLPKGAFQNTEVRNWSKFMFEKGVLKSGYPGLNSYTYIGVRTGVIGLLMHLIPFGYVVFWFLFKNIKLLRQDLQIIFLLISLFGLLATRMATSQFSVCDGIILGLLLLKISEFEEKRNDYVTNKA